MNCSTVNGSVITAAALRAERGMLLAAIPSRAQAIVPSAKTQTRVHQRPAEAGRCR